MEITVNGKLLDFSLENEKTIGEVLQAIENDCVQSNATIIKICVDGNIIRESEFNKMIEAPLEKVKKMELETMSEADVIFFLQNISKAVVDTIDQLQKIPVLLQSSKDGEVSDIVMNFVDRFNSIKQLAFYCSLFPKKFEFFLIEKQSITNFIQDFNPILQEFESSLISHDTVLMGDLAEYEIVPKLQAFVNASSSLYGTPC